MTVGSKINPNFPIPGIDQSSKGFRDNFGIIKQEIENLQGKRIQLVGSLISEPIEISNGTQDIIVPVAVSLTNVQAAGSNLAVQYNFNGIISGSNMFWNTSRLGINKNIPVDELDVVGNIRVQSPYTNETKFIFGPSLAINSNVVSTNFSVDTVPAMWIDHTTRNVGIGTYPTAKFEMASSDNDVARFHAYKDVSDNSIRFSTTPANATMGLVLEQRTANKAGGIRLDQNGIISIHVNESMDANLSDASRVIVIMSNDNVGIGSMTPHNQLDVDGNAYVSGHVGIGTATSSDALGVYGNLRIHNTSVISGIFFADGSFQNTAGGTGGGGGPGTTGPTGPAGITGPTGPYGTQDHLVFSTVAPSTSTFDTSPYTDSNAFLEVFVDSSYLSIDSYTWLGNTLTLNDPVGPGTTVELVIYTALGLATSTGPAGPTGPTGSAGVTGPTGSSTLIAAGYTVASLPTGTIGQIARVTDGNVSLAWGAQVTGGGSTNYLVWYNGSMWTVLGE